ncbi:F0F1 ATP synthase subunit gamma, partial [bacterium]
MATLNEIKTRINAVKNTQKITRAMKMVAASKLRRAQDKIISTRPYAYKMSELLNHLISVADVSLNPLMQEREIKKRLVIVMSSDRGLCGAFNANIIKYTVKYLNETGKDTPLITVGKKVNDYFSKRKYNVIKSHINFFSDLNIEASNEITAFLINGYLENQFDSVEIIYNEFKSVMKQT